MPDDSALQAIPQQIQTLRQQAQTASPEVSRELESYRQADRHYALTRSHTYQRDYALPMNEKCNAWLTKTIQFLPDENQRKDLIKKLNAFGGEEGVAPKVDGTYLRKMLDDISSHGRMDRDSYEILSSDIPQIMGMKKAAQDYLADTARNAEKFANWQQKEQQAGVEAYKANHNGETQKVLAELPEVKTHLDALSPEEFAALNKEYSEVVRDYVSGPRSAARRGMEHVRLQLRTRKKQRA